MTSLLLAIDAGTTGVTTLAFDLELRPLARAYTEFPQSFPRPGWVEHDARDILAAVDLTMARCLADAPGEVLGVGITNQRETVFACERATGSALAPGMVWQDRRTARRCEQLKADGHELMYSARTGLMLDPYFSGTKVEWLLQNVDGLVGRAQAGEVVFATVDALIARHLTGEWRTDPSNASRTLLYDIDAKAWSPDLAEPLGVSVDWLPPVLPSAAAGPPARLPGGASAPLAGILGAQQAALYGQGCWEPGQLKSTYGTGCFLVLNTGERRVNSSNGLLTTLCAARDGSPAYALEGSVFAGGLVIQWLRDQLGILESAEESEALAASVEDSGGVFLVPAFAGLGAPYWDPDARAALLGLTRGTGRGHIARAALESIAFQCTELVELFRLQTA